MPVTYIVIVVVVLVLIFLVRFVRLVTEWNRAVVLRLGRFRAIKGPGLFIVIPLVDQVAIVVDMRVETTTITAEQALTKDTVAVGVDAIVFWQVEDARAAAINIANYRQAIERVAQTSLREMIGSTDLSRLLSDRKSADEQLRITIGEKTGSWGVAIRSVEIKDVMIPPGPAGRHEQPGPGGAGKAGPRDAGLGGGGHCRAGAAGGCHLRQEPGGAAVAADEPALRDEQGAGQHRPHPDRHGHRPWELPSRPLFRSACPVHA